VKFSQENNVSKSPKLF